MIKDKTEARLAALEARVAGLEKVVAGRLPERMESEVCPGPGWEEVHLPPAFRSRLNPKLKLWSRPPGGIVLE